MGVGDTADEANEASSAVLCHTRSMLMRNKHLWRLQAAKVCQPVTFGWRVNVNGTSAFLAGHPPVNRHAGEQLFRGFGASASNKSEPGRHESNSSNGLSGLEQEFCSSSQALLHVISKMDSFKAPRVFITQRQKDFSLFASAD